MAFRDALKRNYLLGKYFLEVEIEDLAGFDEMLADKLYKQPTEHLQIFEDAAREVADEITAPRPEIEDEMQDIQILLQSGANPTNIRDLKVISMRAVAVDYEANIIILLFVLPIQSVGERVPFGENCWHHRERIWY